MRKVSSASERSGYAAATCAPAPEKTAAEDATTERTSSSTWNAPPRSSDSATRRPDREPASGGAKARPGVAQRQRRARVGAGQHREQQRQVADVARHRAADRGALPRVGVRPLGHPAQRRPQPDHAAERRRVAQRATHVGAVGQRHHARAQRARRTAGRAAGGPGRVDRVQGGAEDRVEGVRPGGELRHVGLADRYGAGARGPARRAARRGRGRGRRTAASRTSSASRPPRGCP